MDEKAVELGTVVSTPESPTPTQVDFVVMNGKVHRGQFVEIPFSEGTLIGMIANVRKTNKYFERADAVKEFEAQGVKLFEQFPVNDWEYMLAQVNPLGVFSPTGIKRTTFPPSPGTKVFNAQAEHINQFLGLDEEKGLELGAMEFHPVKIKLNMSKLLQKHFAVLAMSGAGKCVKYDTLVLLADGEQRKIGELVDEVLAKHKKTHNGIESWEEDSELFTYALFDNKIIPSQIRGFHRRKAESIVTLNTRSGKRIEVTPEHMIPVFRGKVEWIKAGEATQDDYLITPRVEWVGKDTTIDVTPIITNLRNVKIERGHAQHRQSKNRMPLQLKVDEDLAELMAYWLAEGHNTGDGQIFFTNENRDIQENFFRIVKEKFYLETKKTKSREQFYSNHAILSRCLPKIGFTNSSWTKFIPKEILQSKKSVLMAFLAAFIDCDGHIEKEKPDIEITLSSKELTTGIREILTKLGIVYISKIKKCKGKEYQRTFISGSDEIRRLKSLNLRINYKKEALEKWCNTKGNPNVDIVPNVNNHIAELLKQLNMSQPQQESSGISNYLYRKDNPSRKSLAVLIRLFEKRLAEVETAIIEAHHTYENIPKTNESLAKNILSAAFANGMQFKQMASGTIVSSTTARRVVRGITQPKYASFLLAQNVLKLQGKEDSAIAEIQEFDGNETLTKIKKIARILHIEIKELCKESGTHKQFLYNHENGRGNADIQQITIFGAKLVEKSIIIQSTIEKAKERIKLLKEAIEMNVFFDQITRKEESKLENEYVYDLTVEHSNFTANNIIIHNSHTISCLLEELLERKKENGRMAIVVFDVHGEYTHFAEPVSDPKFTDYSGKTRLIRARDLKIGVPKLSVGMFGALLPNASPAQKRELGKVIHSLQQKMKDGLGPYDLQDIKGGLLEELSSKDAKDSVIQALIGWIHELEDLRLFGKADNPSLMDLIQPGILTVVDLSDIIHTHKKQVIVGYLAQRIFNERRNKQIPPTVIVLEEAHNFIPQQSSKNEASAKGIMRTIAREGRKFGVSLCLISQRPIQLDTTTLAQCNTQLLLRITNPYDIKHIGESAEGLSAESLGMLTSLKVGEGLLIGEAVHAPTFFKIRQRKSQPSKHEGTLESAGIAYESEAEKNRKETEDLL
ncbi:MAG: DUF87 domain-containing protein [archaeon]